MSDSPGFPFSEILKSIPGFFGIRLEEKPAHTVLEQEGEIEIRRYAPALLAQVTLPGEHDAAMDAAFDRLAGYIFGANAQGEKMSMTNPVFQIPGRGLSAADTDVARVPLRAGEHGTWTMAFFLANNLQPSDAPAPDDPAITLVTEPERVVAVLRYSGNDSAEKREHARAHLLAAVRLHPRWQVNEDVYWAQYDAPFTLPFVKRNEAQVEVVERTA